MEVTKVFLIELLDKLDSSMDKATTDGEKYLLCEIIKTIEREVIFDDED